MSQNPYSAPDSEGRQPSDSQEPEDFVPTSDAPAERGVHVERLVLGRARRSATGSLRATERVRATRPPTGRPLRHRRARTDRRPKPVPSSRTDSRRSQPYGQQQPPYGQSQRATAAAAARLPAHGAERPVGVRAVRSAARPTGRRRTVSSRPGLPAAGVRSAAAAGYPPTAQSGQSASDPYGQPQGYPQQGYPPAGLPAAAGLRAAAPAARLSAGHRGYPQQYQGQQAPMSPSDERLWATLTHISIPFFGFVGPLIAYLVFKDRSPWLKEIDDRGAQLLDPLHDRPDRQLDPHGRGDRRDPAAADRHRCPGALHPGRHRHQQGRAVQVPGQLEDHQVESAAIGGSPALCARACVAHRGSCGGVAAPGTTPSRGLALRSGDRAIA